MLNINPSNIDSCTALAAMAILALHIYGVNEDFLGVGHYYDVYVPPVINAMSFLGMILVFRFLCKRTDRSLPRQPDR